MKQDLNQWLDNVNTVLNQNSILHYIHEFYLVEDSIESSMDYVAAYEK